MSMTTARRTQLCTFTFFFNSFVYVFTLLLPFFPSQNIHFDIYRELVKIAPVIPDEVRRLGAHGSVTISAKVCEFGVIDILLTG